MSEMLLDSRMRRAIDPGVIDSHLRKAIESELNAWGRWIEKRLDYHGFSKSSSLAAFTEGRGTGIGGHRILCLDMPVHIYATHGRVLRLTEEERYAINVWFIFRMKEDGTLWGLAEKAAVVGMDPVELRRLVNISVRKISGLPV